MPFNKARSRAHLIDMDVPEGTTTSGELNVNVSENVSQRFSASSILWDSSDKSVVAGISAHP